MTSLVTKHTVTTHTYHTCYSVDVPCAFVSFFHYSVPFYLYLCNIPLFSPMLREREMPVALLLVMSPLERGGRKLLMIDGVDTCNISSCLYFITMPYQLYLCVVMSVDDREMPIWWPITMEVHDQWYNTLCSPLPFLANINGYTTTTTSSHLWCPLPPFYQS